MSRFKRPGARQVAAERLLDHDAAPGDLVAHRVDEAGLTQPGDDRGEELGRDGQVIDPVASRAQGLVDALERLFESLVRRRIVEGAGRKEDPIGELGPDLLEVGTADLGQRLLVLGAEFGVGPVAAGEADDRGLGRQVAAPRELEERRDELAVGQVAGGAEEHEGARLGHSGPRQRLAQGVGR